MRKSINNYVQSIAQDNENEIVKGGYTSIADYIISTAENGAGFNEYFDAEETAGNYDEPTSEQIDELKEYLNTNFEYLPGR